MLDAFLYILFTPTSVNRIITYCHFMCIISSGSVRDSSIDGSSVPGRLSPPTPPQQIIASLVSVLVQGNTLPPL